VSNTNINQDVLDRSDRSIIYYTRHKSLTDVPEFDTKLEEVKDIFIWTRSRTCYCCGDTCGNTKTQS